MADLVFELFPGASGELETLDDRLVAEYLVV